jgi:hypothetical protein
MVFTIPPEGFIKGWANTCSKVALLDGSTTSMRFSKSAASLFIDEGIVKSPSLILLYVFYKLSVSKGGCPVRKMYIMTPVLQMSTSNE